MQQRTEGNEYTQQHAYRVLAQLIRMRRRLTTKVLGDTSQPHNATNLGLAAESCGGLMISSGFKHEADRPIAEVTHSTTRSQDL